MTSLQVEQPAPVSRRPIKIPTAQGSVPLHFVVYDRNRIRLFKHVLLCIGDKASTCSLIEGEIWPKFAAINSIYLGNETTPDAELFRYARNIIQKQLGSCKTISQPLRDQTTSPAGRPLALASATTEEVEYLHLWWCLRGRVPDLAYALGKSVDAVEDRLRLLMALIQRASSGSDASDIREMALEVMGSMCQEIQLSDTPDPLRVRHPQLRKGTRVGRYAVERLAGKGAFGCVYKVEDTEVRGRKLALKLLHRQTTADDIEEIEAASAVLHPSVVLILDHGVYEGRMWFTMPWYDGMTLEQRLAKHGTLTRDEAASVFVPIAHGISALHQAEIRHGDVKPDNIFLVQLPAPVAGPRGEMEQLPVLLDLGLATGPVARRVGGGTDYMAPEVAKVVDSDETERLRELCDGVGLLADVYSLAKTILRALDPSEQLSSRELRDLRADFNRWLADDPSLRPDASTLAIELRSALHRRSAVVRRRQRIIIAAVTALAIVALIVMVLSTLAAKRAERLTHQAVADKLRDKVDEADHTVELLQVEIATKEKQLERETNSSERAELKKQLKVLESSKERVANESKRARTWFIGAQKSLDQAKQEIRHRDKLLRKRKRRVQELTRQIDTEKKTAERWGKVASKCVSDLRSCKRGLSKPSRCSSELNSCKNDVNVCMSDRNRLRSELVECGEVAQRYGKALKDLKSQR